MRFFLVTLLLAVVTYLHPTAANYDEATNIKILITKIEITLEKLVSSERAISSKLQVVKQAIEACISKVSTLKSRELLPSSCSDLTQNETDAYYIQPRVENAESFKVLCDFGCNHGLGGGWTVFQHRFDGSVDFYRNWTMYKTGFGQVTQEHWLGLEKLHTITASGPHQLLVLLEDFDGNSMFALYDDFSIGSEAEGYKLTVGEYLDGTVGDSLTNHNGKKFSTFDKEHSGTCAKSFHGAWWFTGCLWSHLNGEYVQKGEYYEEGIKWLEYSRYNSLKMSKMMLRRRT